MKTPSIKFKTFGCKVNQYEPQQWREYFLKKGYAELNTSRKADLYLVNTCTVTQKSDNEAAHFIRNIIRDNPKTRIIISGCCLNNKNSPVLKIPGISKKIKKLSRRLISNFKGHNCAFIKIQDGCNHFCSYCIVPFVRGRPESKPFKKIVEEAANLVKNGFKEIVLSGIHLGAYGIDLSQHIDIVDVIEKLEDIKGEFRIRLSSLDPKEVSQRLIEKLVSSKKLCPHLHIPLQSGDNKILKLMKRNYTSRQYLSLVKKLKKAVPGISITTDIIVGFPGESEKNFQNTINLVRKINFSRMHIFSYSPREGTRACNFPGRVTPDIIRRRFKTLQLEARQASLRRRKKMLGKISEILIEDKRDKKTNLLTGYSEHYFRVMLSGPDNLKNKLVKVKLKKIENAYFLGDFL